MRVLVYKNAEAVAKAAATLFAAQIEKKPDSVLGLATGSTPVQTYQELIKMNKEGMIDFSQVRTYNLDEYIGLDGTHDQSYRYFMNFNLFDHVNIDKANTHVPCGTGSDPWADAKAYDEMVASAGGIDIQLLGIGRNGHIGFNEPNTEFIYNTNIVNLTQSTIDANKIYFESEDAMPKKAITMGVGTIMAAKCVLLLATGSSKADAIAKTVKGNIDPQVPASILKAHHNAIIICDEAAAANL